MLKPEEIAELHRFGGLLLIAVPAALAWSALVRWVILKICRRWLP